MANKQGKMVSKGNPLNNGEHANCAYSKIWYGLEQRKGASPQLTQPTDQLPHASDHE